MKCIVLTGGGTAGHVTPNLALIESLESLGWHIHYIGSQAGIERFMIEREGLPYYPIRTGKLRRYFTWKNFIEPFHVLGGIWQAYRYLKVIQPQIVFSKGGFVAFPVVFSAWLRRIPVVAHESDLTPGLANRLSFPFVSKLCVAFSGTKQAFAKHSKVMVTGTPIRAALFLGDKQRALKQCGFREEKPIILVMGGSLGAQKLNDVVRAVLPELCQKFQVIHLCGKNKLDKTVQHQTDYYQCEYAHDEMADFLSASQLVISRAGANSIYELLALNKPNILIPLSKGSRGDQIENARYFEAKEVSKVLTDEEVTPQSLMAAIDDISERLAIIQNKIQQLGIESATKKIIEIIEHQSSQAQREI